MSSEEERAMDAREPFLNSANSGAHPCACRMLGDVDQLETEACRLLTAPDWPQLESPEFKELVLSIIATSIRLNPFQGSGDDEQRPV